VRDQVRSRAPQPWDQRYRRGAPADPGALPIGRMGTPLDIARGIVFLASTMPPL